MSLSLYLQKIHAREPLSEPEAAAACEILMRQEIGTPAAGAYLMALAQRGETAEEMVGMALNMRKRTSQITSDKKCCDIISCGTKDSAASVVLGASLLLTTAGVAVAKLLTPAMGNVADIRSVAATLGVSAANGPQAAIEALESTIFSILDPADYIDLLRSVRAHQESIPVPTIFDRLMPLSHPADLQSILVGVSPASSAIPMAQAFRRLRIKRAVVLATPNGTCPFTYNGKIAKVELIDGKITETEIAPADFGFDFSAPENIAAADAEKQGAWLRAFIDGRDSPLKAPILWSTGLALYASGQVETLEAGFAKAKEALAGGHIGGVLALAGYNKAA